MVSSGKGLEKEFSEFAVSNEFNENTLGKIVEHALWQRGCCNFFCVAKPSVSATYRARPALKIELPRQCSPQTSARLRTSRTLFSLSAPMKIHRLLYVGVQALVDWTGQSCFLQSALFWMSCWERDRDING